MQIETHGRVLVVDDARPSRLEDLVAEKMSEVKVLTGLLPICFRCKKIRDDEGYWGQLEVFIHKHSEAELSHGICPDCMELVYAERPELRPQEPS